MPTGKNANINETLDHRLSTLVLNPVRRVAYENLAFTPNQGEIYLRATNMRARADYASVGTLHRRHRGIYQVDIFGPPNTGPITQLEIADLVVEHFVGQNIVRNSITVRIGSIDGSEGVPWISAAVVADGWRHIPVNIPWWSDTFA